MLKQIFLIFSMQIWLFASYIEEFEWPKGVFLSNFLEFHKIPLSIYNDLSDDDKELAAEIKAGTKFQVLFNNSDHPLQFFVPISEEMAMVIKQTKQKKWSLDFIPINYTTKTDVLNIEINKNPTLDIAYNTGNNALANAFLAVFKNGVNFKGLKKGDRLVITYTQKIRHARPHSQPQINSAMIEENGKKFYRYFFNDKFFDENGQEVLKQFLFALPIPGAQVSSKFTLKRFHPILRRYRAHLGTDYRSPTGTQIRAAADGVVLSVGRQNGYGNTIEIKHIGGYKTLYAHMKGYVSGIKKGQSIMQGQIIGYVGSTGLSSGPHLHMGLYKNNVAMDFEKAVHIEKKVEKTTQQKEFDALVKSANAQIQQIVDTNTTSQLIFQDYPNLQDL